ncbi:hypothetical protein BT93_E2010 [Corymbia citriodora subsp. variegata]|nr:hypothetical protein BT93_E2010 [Corymbia citriodora subsp. variegata]
MVQSKLLIEFKVSITRVVPTEEETCEIIEIKLPMHKTKHLKALMVVRKIKGHPVIRILIDTGTTLNLMPNIYFQKLGKDEDKIIPTNVTLTTRTIFFISNADVSYNLLGKEWIHSNQCIPSSLHQVLSS